MLLIVSHAWFAKQIATYQPAAKKESKLNNSQTVLSTLGRWISFDEAFEVLHYVHNIIPIRLNELRE